MNRQSLTQSLESIRAAIELARDQDPDNSLLPNYNAGIRLCDDLITTVQSNAVLTYDNLMGRFNYYVSDSLPWTNSLLTTIDRESQNISTAIRDDDRTRSS